MIDINGYITPTENESLFFRKKNLFQNLFSLISLLVSTIYIRTFIDC